MTHRTVRNSRLWHLIIGLIVYLLFASMAASPQEVSLPDDCDVRAQSLSLTQVRRSLMSLDYECALTQLDVLLCDLHIMRAIVYYQSLGETVAGLDSVVNELVTAFKLNPHWNGELNPQPPGLLPLLDVARGRAADIGELGAVAEVHRPTAQVDFTDSQEASADAILDIVPTEIARSHVRIVRISYHPLANESKRSAGSAEIIWRYRFGSRVGLGAGAGYSTFDDGHMIPLFADARFQLVRAPVPLFMFSDLGYSLRQDRGGGILFVVGAGFDLKVSQSMGLEIEVAFRSQKAKLLDYWPYLSSCDCYMYVPGGVGVTRDYRSIAASVGVKF